MIYFIYIIYNIHVYDLFHIHHLQHSCTYRWLCERLDNSVNIDTVTVYSRDTNHFPPSNKANDHIPVIVYGNTVFQSYRTFTVMVFDPFKTF